MGETFAHFWQQYSLVASHNLQYVVHVFLEWSEHFHEVMLFWCQKDSCLIIFQLSTTNCMYIFWFCTVGRFGTSMFKRVLSDIIVIIFHSLLVLTQQNIGFFSSTKIDNKRHTPSVPEYMHKECKTCLHCYCISPSPVYTTLM